MLENKTEVADLPIQKTLPGLTRNSVLITENELHALVSTYMYCVVVNFLFQVIFIFPLFWGMVMYANEFKTKGKPKLTEIKNELQHICL